MPSSPTDAIGGIPYRLALAGGWIDQPFVSRLLPRGSGSMVVVGVEPTYPFLERAGVATGTRKVAQRAWGNHLPPGDPAELVRELYELENAGKAEPSGSQDMIGLIYPGINRLDYDSMVEGGVFPSHIASCRHPETARWLERTIHLLPVAPRPDGYNPLEEKNLSTEWAERLGQSGKECYAAILCRDPVALGRSMNHCMDAWSVLLPNTVRHRTLTTDLVGLLRSYQAQYPGAMYSGCGGGYLYIASEKPVPGTFNVTVRL